MSKENKLRKFKLIDKKGYLSCNSENPSLYRDYFSKEDTFLGSLNDFGSVISVNKARVILKDELQYFEEITLPPEYLFWQENTPLEAGLIVGKNCCGEKEFTVKYAGRETVMLEDSNGEESTAPKGNLKSLIKSDKEVMFEKVLSAWKGTSIEGKLLRRDSVVHLGDLFDVMYSVMKGE